MLKNVYEEEGHLFSCLYFMLLKSVYKILLAFHAFYKRLRIDCLLLMLFISEGLFTFYAIYE